MVPFSKLIPPRKIMSVNLPDTQPLAPKVILAGIREYTAAYHRLCANLPGPIKAEMTARILRNQAEITESSDKSVTIKWETSNEENEI